MQSTKETSKYFVSRCSENITYHSTFGQIMLKNCPIYSNIFKIIEGVVRLYNHKSMAQPHSDLCLFSDPSLSSCLLVLIFSNSIPLMIHRWLFYNLAKSSSEVTSDTFCFHASGRQATSAIMPLPREGWEEVAPEAPCLWQSWLRPVRLHALSKCSASIPRQ